MGQEAEAARAAGPDNFPGSTLQRGLAREKGKRSLNDGVAC